MKSIPMKTLVPALMLAVAAPLAAQDTSGSTPSVFRRFGEYVAGKERQLASGPGKLAAALAIDHTSDGHALDRTPLWIEKGTPVARRNIVAGPRIGITKAADWPLRFCIRDCAWLSRRHP